MPVITRLVAGKRDPSRVNLYLEGKFAFALSVDEVLGRSLKVGQELTEQLIQSLKNLSVEEKIYAKILNYLSYRPRSQSEVEQRLRRYLLGHDNQAAVIAQIIARLTKNGYLDDLAFATWFVESRNTNRPRSRVHLTAELMGKGVSRELIQQVLLAHTDDEEVIRQLIAKKRGMDEDKLKNYLLRRGFSYQLILRVLATFH